MIINSSLMRKRYEYGCLSWTLPQSLRPDAGMAAHRALVSRENHRRLRHVRLSAASAHGAHPATRRGELQRVSQAADPNVCKAYCKLNNSALRLYLRSSFSSFCLSRFSDGSSSRMIYNCNKNTYRSKQLFLIWR